MLPLAPENLDRRSFLNGLGALAATTAVATAGLAQKALADEVTPVVAAEEIAYRESELGIDYRAIADAPVDAMLSQGEAEWMANASEKFGDRTAAFWTNIASVLGRGTISDSIEGGLKNYAPNMLIAFGENIPAEDPKYGLLAAVGDSFRLDRHLGEDR